MKDDATVSFISSIANDPGCFGVVVSPTPYATTKEWLEAQPAGGQTSAGYQPLFWLDEGSGNGARAFVLRYTIVDRDGATPIYGKIIEGVAVGNGKLYRFSYMNQLPHDAVPQLSDTTLKLFSGFHVLSGN